MKTDTSHPPPLALGPSHPTSSCQPFVPSNRPHSPNTSPVSSPVPSPSATPSPTHSESPPPVSPRTKKIYRAPIAKPSPAEESLVRCIHAKVGGPSKLSTYDDPADVRAVVIEALATEQTSGADTTRIRRGQLTVFERRVVRTVTNRGAAVRSRMRQRREVAHLRSQLRLRDARILQLDAAVRSLCAAYSVPVAAAIHGRPPPGHPLGHPAASSAPAVHAAAAAAVAAAASTMGSSPAHQIPANAAEVVATAAANAAATSVPHQSLHPPPPQHQASPHAQPLPPTSVMVGGVRAALAGSQVGSSPQLSFGGSSVPTTTASVIAPPSMTRGHGLAGGKESAVEVPGTPSGDLGFSQPDLLDSFMHEMMNQPAWALK